MKYPTLQYYRVISRKEPNDKNDKRRGIEPNQPRRIFSKCFAYIKFHQFFENPLPIDPSSFRKQVKKKSTRG